ncbi:MAG TPA: hypothetical protein VKA96_00175 [Solirubrobacteraceae bacterium]|nr:hypothetical protein [Solirubrobacteraceae bacterium]
MDPFVLIILGIVAGLVLWILFLGVYHPRSASEVLDWRPTRSVEIEVQNELDDIEQMLEATNTRRRARGDAELTEAQLHARVRDDLRDANERRERYLASSDLHQMLEATNERRRRRGEPELTEAQYRAQVETDQASLGRRSD